MKRSIRIVAVISGLAFWVGCSSISQAGFHEPDEILYERGMLAFDQNKPEVGCLTLQTMVASYPESGYVGRATEQLAKTECDNTRKWAGYPDHVEFFPATSDKESLR